MKALSPASSLCFKVVLVIEKASRETEITDFQVTILVHKDIGRLEIAMHHLSGVHVQHRAQNLVHEVLHVLIR